MANNKNNFWLDNPLILFQKDKIKEFYPNNHLTFNEKCNAISRFFIYFGILSFLFFNDVKYLIVAIIALVMTCFFYRYICSYHDTNDTNKTNETNESHINSLNQSDYDQNSNTSYQSDTNINKSNQSDYDQDSNTSYQSNTNINELNKSDNNEFDNTTSQQFNLNLLNQSHDTLKYADTDTIRQPNHSKIREIIKDNNSSDPVACNDFELYIDQSYNNKLNEMHNVVEKNIVDDASTYKIETQITDHSMKTLFSNTNDLLKNKMFEINSNINSTNYNDRSDFMKWCWGGNKCSKSLQIN